MIFEKVFSVINMSPSPRRAWIEISIDLSDLLEYIVVALPTEGVD